MSTEWSEVPLGEVLKVSNDYMQIDPAETYKISGIYGWGRGMLSREPLQGKNTSYKRFVRLHENDLALSHLKAWEGAIARVPETYNGWFLSTQFSTFRPIPERLDIGYLEWFCKLPKLWETLEKGARGMGARRSTVSAEQFLSVPISLPPLSEQRRIVGRLEHLASKIEEARGLREQTAEEVELILAAEEMKIWPDEALEDAPTLEEITTHLARGKQSKQGQTNHYLVKTRHVQMGVYMPSDMMLASEAAAKVRPEAVLQDGDVMIASSAAGCLGRVAYYADDGRTTSTDTHISVARADQNKILPEYLYAYLKGAQGQVQLRSRERGDWQREKIGFRFTELNIGNLRKVPVPLPSIPEQHKVTGYLNHFQAKVDSLKQLQAQTRGELDALLPSVLDKAFRGEL